jgi:hypothetical protein
MFPIFVKSDSMESELAIKNDRQVYYNQVKGVITELNDDVNYCSITLKVGHENTRDVNLSMKKTQYDSIIEGLYLGKKVLAKFFVVSRKKTDRWYTSANLLELENVGE